MVISLRTLQSKKEKICQHTKKYIVLKIAVSISLVLISQLLNYAMCQTRAFLSHSLAKTIIDKPIIHFFKTLPLLDLPKATLVIEVK